MILLGTRPKEIKMALWLFAASAIMAITLSLYDSDYPGGISTLSLIFLYGIWRASALAWQWSRFVFFGASLTLALVVISGIGIGFSQTDWHVLRRLIFFTLNSAIGLYALWLLNRPSSREYFGLVCPLCGMQSVRAKNLFFTRKACKSCGSEW